jgi:uncharacterized protein
MEDRKIDDGKRQTLRIVGLATTALGVVNWDVAKAATMNTKVFGRSVQDVWGDDNAILFVQAAANGDRKQMDALIKSGVNVDVKGKNDWTPLAWVTVLGNLDGMRKLLELGANPNHRFIDGPTGTVNPLVMAISQKRHCDRLEILLNRGLNPNSRWGFSKEDGYEGRSLLMESVMSKPCVELLVKHGADVNFTLEIGRGTALIRAANLGQLEVAEFLLNHGANVDLDMAAISLQNGLVSDEAHRVKLLRMLKERGAKIPPSQMYPNTPKDLLTPGT